MDDLDDELFLAMEIPEPTSQPCLPSEPSSIPSQPAALAACPVPGPVLNAALFDHFGYDAFREGQREVIEGALTEIVKECKFDMDMAVRALQEMCEEAFSSSNVG